MLTPQVCPEVKCKPNMHYIICNMHSLNYVLRWPPMLQPTHSDISSTEFKWNELNDAQGTTPQRPMQRRNAKEIDEPDNGDIKLHPLHANIMGHKSPDSFKREVDIHIKTLIPLHSCHHHKPQSHADGSMPNPISTCDTWPQKGHWQSQSCTLVTLLVLFSHYWAAGTVFVQTYRQSQIISNPFPTMSWWHD